MRLLAAGGAPERGWALLSILDQFDPILQPLAVDEIGMSGETSAYEQLMRLASDEPPRSIGPYLRLKAIEALGRLRSAAATELLREIVESKKRWRWAHHAELRIAALQALEAISPATADSLRSQSGFSDEDLSLHPRAPSPKSRWSRQRRYPRVRLKATVPSTATSDRETVVLDTRGLSLSGGLATGGEASAAGNACFLASWLGLAADSRPSDHAGCACAGPQLRVRKHGTGGSRPSSFLPPTKRRGPDGMARGGRNEPRAGWPGEIAWRN